MTSAPLARYIPPAPPAMLSGTLRMHPTEARALTVEELPVIGVGPTCPITELTPPRPISRAKAIRRLMPSPQWARSRRRLVMLALAELGPLTSGQVANHIGLSWQAASDTLIGAAFDQLLNSTVVSERPRRMLYALSDRGRQRIAMEEGED